MKARFFTNSTVFKITIIRTDNVYQQDQEKRHPSKDLSVEDVRVKFEEWLVKQVKIDTATGS